jgi:hypothetical protein
MEEYNKELFNMVNDLKHCIDRLTSEKLSQFDIDKEAYWIGEAHELLNKINPNYYTNANKDMENNCIEYLAKEMNKLIPPGNELLIEALIHNANKMRDKENAEIIKSSFSEATNIISKEFKKWNVNYHNI